MQTALLETAAAAVDAVGAAVDAAAAVDAVDAVQGSEHDASGVTAAAVAVDENERAAPWSARTADEEGAVQTVSVRTSRRDWSIHRDPPKSMYTYVIFKNVTL